MKVTFIYPNMLPGTPADRIEPLVFAILSALTPPDVKRVFYDQRLESIPFDEPTDLVALSVGLLGAKSAYQISHEFRRRGIPVVMGGHHPSLLPEEVLQHATSIVIGDAEDTWPELVEDARKGALKQVYHSNYPGLQGLKADRSIFRGKRYLPLAMVQFGRGCQYACEFCSVHAFYGNRIRYRPINEVVEEIRQIGRKFICFSDDSFFADVDHSRELLKAIKPLRIRWISQACIDIAADRELVRLTAESGCIALIIGFESMIQDNLRQMGKSWSQAGGTYDELVQVLHNFGIMVYGLFITGYDYDSKDSFRMILDFSIRRKLLNASIVPLHPIPGTPLYKRLDDEHRLLPSSWWLHPDFRYGQTWFQPKQMTREELSAGCYQARVQLYKFGNIFRRAFNFKANCRSLINVVIYLVINLVLRHEHYRRQGKSLGDSKSIDLQGSVQ
jgi:radical SAM superfamily enzyme YgiQ (UPF0313 family)